MGQAKNRGTREERIALALAWDEAHHEEWERQRPQREAEEARRPRRGRSGMGGGATFALLSIIAMNQRSR